MPRLGLIVTYVPSLADARRSLATMRADDAKWVAAWGLPGGWSQAAIAEAAHMAPQVLLRSSWGDPSCRLPDGEDRTHPYAGRVLDEAAPWFRARADLSLEIGNEPYPHHTDRDAYAYHLGKAVERCRDAFPRARLIGPAFSLNDERDDPTIAQWLVTLRPHYRRCMATGGGVAVHAYTAEQLRRGLDLVREHAGADVPVWLTEVNLGEDMPPAERGQRLWDLVGPAPVVAAYVYHLDLSGAPSTLEQGPDRYRVHADTLAALGLRGEVATRPAPPRPASPQPPPAPPAAPAGAPSPRLSDLHIRDLRPQLPVIKERRPKPRRGTPTSVTLHYNGPAVAAHGKPAAELRHIIQVDAPWHQNNPKIRGDGLQYHLCVLSDGSIYQTRNLDLPAWHCGDAVGNASSLAVHLPLGGTQDATPAQWAATEQLFLALIAEYGMPGDRQAVKGHDAWSDTLCPGPQLKRRLVAWRQGAAPAGGLFRIRTDVPAANVREGPGTGFPIALGGKARMWPGDVVDADALVEGEAVGGDRVWLHRRDGVGFVHRSLVEGL